MMHLDFKSIKSISLPPDKTKLVISDPTCEGLYFEVRKKARTFIFRKMIKGKVVHKKLGAFPTLGLQDARKICTDLLTQCEDLVTNDEQSRITVSSFFHSHYLPISQRLHKTTPQRVSSYKTYIEPTFGNHKFVQISKAGVQKWKDELILSNLAPATVNRIIVLFGQILKFARDYDIPDVPSKDTLGLSLLPVQNQREVFLTKDELSDLLQACEESSNRDLADIVRVLVLTGARKRELLDAKWAHLNFERQALWLPETKNGKPRNLSLGQSALAVFHKRKAEIEKSPYIFANPKTKKPYASIHYAWDVARLKAGFPDLRIHDLRHSFASALVNQGVSLYEVQFLLGHKSIKSTQRYSHLDNQRLLRSVEHVSKYFD